MTRRLAIIWGRPDPSGNHLLHAMADADADAAASAGQDVRRIEVAQLAFPPRRAQVDFENQRAVACIGATQRGSSLGAALGVSVSALRWNHAGTAQGPFLERSTGPHLPRSFAWFLASWAKLLSWREVSQRFQTSWESVFRSVEMAVIWGRAHMDLTGISARGSTRFSGRRVSS